MGPSLYRVLYETSRGGVRSVSRVSHAGWTIKWTILHIVTPIFKVNSSVNTGRGVGVVSGTSIVFIQESVAHVRLTVFDGLSGVQNSMTCREWSLCGEMA